jgi:hypothetical protein
VILFQLTDRERFALQLTVQKVFQLQLMIKND